MMNDLLIGTPIDQVAFRLERDVKPVLSAKIKEHEELFNDFLDACVRFASSKVYVYGLENMLYQPEYNDVNKLRRIVSAFENSQVWNALQPLSDEEGVTVRIGSDSPINEIEDVSVISASFRTGERTKGSISVIGPTRMPYEKVVSKYLLQRPFHRRGQCTGDDGEAGRRRTPHHCRGADGGRIH